MPPVQLWSGMPGWGIAADLTPPELINSRQLKALRKLLAAGLVALVVACIGGYVVAARQHASASRTLDSVQARTTQLQFDARKYAGVTKIQGTVTGLQAQIATLMSGDVDLVTLIGKLRSNLPARMTISQESVTISVAAVASAGAPAGGLDMSGLARIADITIAGTGRTLDDLSTYVDKLKVIPGIVDVVPGSNVLAASGTAYTLSFGLTSKLLSHRFDVTPKASK